MVVKRRHKKGLGFFLLRYVLGRALRLDETFKVCELRSSSCNSNLKSAMPSAHKNHWGGANSSNRCHGCSPRLTIERSTSTTIELESGVPSCEGKEQNYDVPATNFLEMTVRTLLYILKSLLL